MLSKTRPCRGGFRISLKGGAYGYTPLAGLVQNVHTCDRIYISRMYGRSDRVFYCPVFSCEERRGIQVDFRGGHWRLRPQWQLASVLVVVKGPPSWNERCVLVIFVLFWAYAVFGCRFCFTSSFTSPFLPSFLFVSFCFCSTSQLVPRAFRDFCNIPFERRCLVGIGDTCWRFFSLRGILCSFPPSTLFCLSSTSQPVSCAVRDIPTLMCGVQ